MRDGSSRGFTEGAPALEWVEVRDQEPISWEDVGPSVILSPSVLLLEKGA